MKPKVVTFDCANTLVRVRWTPGGFALDCARAVGMELGDEDRAQYERALRARWGEYQEINQRRSPEVGDAFWLELTGDWLEAIGKDRSRAKDIAAVAPDLLYGESAEQFELFDDVRPTLQGLADRGIALGVISNWDYSLHRVLRALRVYDAFEHVVASLEEGVEKPDPRLFDLTLARFGVKPDEALHVGDDPVDDLRGAQDFGMSAWLIDRSHAETRPPLLARLTDLLEVVDRP